MPDTSIGCVQPAKGPTNLPEAAAVELTQDQNEEEGKTMVAQVGKPAPDFEANAFVDGGFKTVSLSDYSGQWVVLCFYPGDFTFV